MLREFTGYESALDKFRNIYPNAVRVIPTDSEHQFGVVNSNTDMNSYTGGRGRGGPLFGEGSEISVESVLYNVAMTAHGVYISPNGK